MLSQVNYRVPNMRFLREKLPVNSLYLTVWLALLMLTLEALVLGLTLEVKNDSSSLSFFSSRTLSGGMGKCPLASFRNFIATSCLMLRRT